MSLPPTLRYCCILLLVLPALLQAQQSRDLFGNQRESPQQRLFPYSGLGGAAYYDLSFGTGLTIPVNLWGYVRAPGRYIVPSSTTLVQLLSFGGGPTEYARLTDVRVIRDVRVDTTIIERVLVYNLELYQRTGDPSQNPILYPGDTVIVPGGALSTLEVVVSVVRDVLLILQAAVTLVLFFRGGQ
ncbi:MAG: SLBB domain-containing protein [Candidatus Kapabacteria bacterium]|nr:SLBB domain-containing protein [Candidatus Kapabacteria bacterium]MCS7169768.1 SLBB domain-containing protein [Candidatus Kapabacteria bacterium]MDW7996412.1 SLBB domain-containing protein [Bacteroidota bacterium]MDW8225884.1 SLBB domain-containing protein [Bacteroidota bacterium]